MNWTPLSLAALNIEIKKGENNMTPTEYCFWEQIKIKPIKWEELTLGIEGQGFWVVALYQDQVLYYNDIEDGFNWSTYEKEGTIKDYFAEQDELQFALLKLEIKAALFIDKVRIGTTRLQICDHSMGVLRGHLLPNENYQHFQLAIMNQCDEKGISNTTDFNYTLVLENSIILLPQEGIGLVHFSAFPNEITVETAGNNLEDWNMV